MQLVAWWRRRRRQNQRLPDQNVRQIIITITAGKRNEKAKTMIYTMSNQWVSQFYFILLLILYLLANACADFFVPYIHTYRVVSFSVAAEHLIAQLCALSPARSCVCVCAHFCCCCHLTIWIAIAIENPKTHWAARKIFSVVKRIRLLFRIVWLLFCNSVHIHKHTYTDFESLFILNAAAHQASMAQTNTHTHT